MTNELNKTARRWWGCIYDQYENATDDVELLLNLIGGAPQNIFEICCGTGRILVPLAKAGHDVTGIDADEGMLARLPAKSEGLANLRYTLDNALTADWGGSYDVVILADNTLMNIEHRDDDKAAQQRFIQKSADALKPGGHFFVAYDVYSKPKDIFVTENKISKGWYNGTDEAGVYGQTFNCGGLYNPVTQIAVWANHIELIAPGGEKFIIPDNGHKYICTRDDVYGWLKNAGFIIEKEFGGYDGRSFSKESNTDVIWARKI